MATHLYDLWPMNHSLQASLPNILIDTLSQASRNNSAVTVETEDAPVQSNRDEGLTHM